MSGTVRLDFAELIKEAMSDLPFPDGKLPTYSTEEVEDDDVRLGSLHGHPRIIRLVMLHSHLLTEHHRFEKKMEGLGDAACELDRVYLLEFGVIVDVVGNLANSLIKLAIPTVQGDIFIRDRWIVVGSRGKACECAECVSMREKMTGGCMGE